mmetsp:Transcript_6974/g.13640  ORF Transcript_6974/g.13640 Transcript_6974/m.13640 type:complete len:137 (-) Transcript_6974:2513-2923(-)
MDSKVSKDSKDASLTYADLFDGHDELMAEAELMIAKLRKAVTESKEACAIACAATGDPILAIGTGPPPPPVPVASLSYADLIGGHDEFMEEAQRMTDKLKEAVMASRKAREDADKVLADFEKDPSNELDGIQMARP